MIGDVSTGQNMIRINGPESIVQTVQTAEVDVDVTGFTSDIITNADIVLYDAEGNQVDTSQISMNAKTVNVNVTIYGTKYVPLKFTIKGEPARLMLRIIFQAELYLEMMTITVLLQLLFTLKVSLKRPLM